MLGTSTGVASSKFPSGAGPSNQDHSTHPENYEVKNKINVKTHIRMAACHTSKAGFETKCSD